MYYSGADDVGWQVVSFGVIYGGDNKVYVGGRGSSIDLDEPLISGFFIFLFSKILNKNSVQQKI